MEPVGTAIMAAITAAASSGIGEAGKKAIVDSYEALTALLKKKLGQTGEVVDALEDFERKPKSAERQQTMKERFESAGVDKEAELVAMAQALLGIVKSQPGGERHIHYAVWA